MKKFVSILLAILTVCSLCACGSTESTPKTDNPSISESQTTEPTLVQDEGQKEESVKYDSYQAILDDYTVKIQEAVPGLINEYNTEAASNTGGLEGLATICNAKVSKLAEISNEGVSEIAEYYYKHGSGAYEEYSEWAGKIMDVYMEEAGKIQDAYMESAK